MDHDEFYKWLDKNTPSGCDQDEFIEYLAMMAVIMINHAALNTGRSVADIIDFSHRSGASLTNG